jgi:hypothetical protein
MACILYQIDPNINKLMYGIWCVNKMNVSNFQVFSQTLLNLKYKKKIKNLKYKN